MDPWVFEILPQDLIFNVVLAQKPVGHGMFTRAKEFGGSPDARNDGLPNTLFRLLLDHLVNGDRIVRIDSEGELTIPRQLLDLCPLE